jgi:hypothetical protein
MDLPSTISYIALLLITPPFSQYFKFLSSILESKAQLRHGDLLFTMSGDEAGHASIYVPKAGSKLTTVHADNDGDYRQLKKTSLPPGDYIVFRCKDSKLADLAAHIADNWASYSFKLVPRCIPYEEL